MNKSQYRWTAAKKAMNFQSHRDETSCPPCSLQICVFPVIPFSLHRCHDFFPCLETWWQLSFGLMPELAGNHGITGSSTPHLPHFDCISSDQIRTPIPKGAKETINRFFPNVLFFGTARPTAAAATTHGAPQGPPNHHDADHNKPHTRPNTALPSTRRYQYSIIRTIVFHQIVAFAKTKRCDNSPTIPPPVGNLGYAYAPD